MKAMVKSQALVARNYTWYTESTDTGVGLWCLRESKNCGHRIHVLFMMYDVYWYCQMKKNERLWKFWKRNDLYENFEKRGVVEKGERRKRNLCPMRLCKKQISERMSQTSFLCGNRTSTAKNFGRIIVTQL